MKLVKPSFEILTATVDPLQLIERAGRTCYKSEDKITDDSAEKFVEMIRKRGHYSVIEHAIATVKFVIDRGVSHELVRHRICSLSQESSRYCDYKSKGVTFVIPPWIDIEPGDYDDLDRQAVESAKNERVDKVLGTTAFPTVFWMKALWDAELYYKILRSNDWTPQQARSVLPNSLKTEIVMTANFREWHHVFTLRTSKAAHPQMREIMIPTCKEFQKRFPIVFDGI